MLALTYIPTHVLAKVDNERLQRGVIGLATGAYSLTITRFTDSEISAFVSNGDDKTYSVTLTEGRSFCGCPDSMYRGANCKHQVALALYAIRSHSTVKAEPQREEPKPLDLSLRKVRRS